MLQPQKIQEHLERISQRDLPIADFLKRNIFMYSLWLVGIPAFIYGLADRGLVAYQRNFSEVTLLSHCMIAFVALVSWLIIGMAVKSSDAAEVKARSRTSAPLLKQRFKLPNVCLAEQTYRLPFSHRCQIYHLLNLKHLEDIHRFSLGNLKVTEVSHFKETQTGGRIRFKTELDSSTNVLRLWRNPVVEVELILHTPYHIELKVPAYNQKNIHVLFNVLPISDREHTLSVQIFSDLKWPNILLRAVLIIAASLTLLEDLPYLNQLDHGKVGRPKQLLSSPPSAPTMQLFRRYVHLYGHHFEQAKLPA